METKFPNHMNKILHNILKAPGLDKFDLANLKSMLLVLQEMIVIFLIYFIP